ncbi:hypothetical protein PR002_g15945 [Phytophthora rubi]|uniref:RxLR effector PexRD54 WY domain-containing protein n=1 Tax=Phytophthora rubi TaxID=129364 RepID=A0A6A3KXP7_9STRA|nr:hypothetical protein PR002_g15945 [Phytophthora rubi]
MRLHRIVLLVAAAFVATFSTGAESRGTISVAEDQRLLKVHKYPTNDEERVGIAPSVTTEQINAWLKKGETADDVFKQLALHNAADDVLASPILQEWVGYMKLFNQKFPKKQTSLISTLTSNYGDDRLAKMIQVAKRSKVPETANMAKRLEFEQIHRWLGQQETPEKVFLLLKLDDVGVEPFLQPQMVTWAKYIDSFDKANPGDKAFESPVLAMWLKYVAFFKDANPLVRVNVAEILKRYYANDVLGKMLIEALKVPSTKKIAKSTLDALTIGWMYQKVKPEMVYKWLLVDGTAADDVGRKLYKSYNTLHYDTVQWLCERGLHTPEDETTAKRTARALRLEDRNLVEFLLHGGGLDQDSSAFLTPERVDAILEFAADPDCAVHAFPAVIELQSASLMEKLVQLHSPLPKDHVAWLYVWKIALTESCRLGDLSSLRWQMEHWLGCEACSDLLDEFDFASFMAAASGGGHVEVMEYIHQLKLLDGLRASVIFPAINNGHLDAVKWLFSHGWRAERNVPFAILDAAAGRRGDLDFLDYFHTLSTLDVYQRSYEGEVRQLTLPMSVVWARSHVMEVAAGNGDLDTIKWLYANGLEGSLHSSINMLRNAAECGYLELVKWMYTYLPQRYRTYAMEAMEKAAANGHLDVVKWLVAVLPKDCKNNAIDGAAGSGYLEIVKWLHENTNAGCSHRAMDLAASSGRMRVLEWLHENTDAGCSVDAMDGAAANGHLNVVKWLHENRSEGCSVKAIESAAGEIDLKMVMWLREHYPHLVLTNAYLAAYLPKFFEMLLFLSVHYRELFTRDFVDSMKRRLMDFCDRGSITGSDAHIASWLQDWADKLRPQS